ncbi:ABC transporter substrate-binding protein [Saccharibacillus sp. CPCC 101409]|uniref:ABC transporter substrate-binding protein n=1 Tax=Saccharibacillus sp. CPCC 101409 TaxID=3058041 RepID=UPI0026734EEA|nr:ABC transporter substrate-binding protein [Saccharibacillus sp. CPCC 101409]MDO3408667.1 ABC transporter substrate-binding protein [Saccharibacillus sp. CPCC 101409]
MNANKKVSVKSLLLIVLAMVMVLVTACSKGSDSAATGNADEKNEDGTYKNNLTISYAGITDISKAKLDDKFHKTFSDKFNITWDYNYVDWDSWGEKLRLWINSGDLPDFASWNYVNGDAMNYIDQGLFYKFPDDWKERWPNAAKAYASTGLGDRLEEKVGGTYVLPRPVYFQNKPADPLLNQIGVIAIRKDWAKEVGFELKDAYTVSELMEYAELVKEKDPGKVGSKLIPMSFNAGDILTGFVMANNAHARVESAFYKGEDGKYKWGPADESTLTGLKLAQQAYKEGLLDPEFYTWKNNEGGDAFKVTGISAIGGLGGLASYRQDMDTAMKKNLNLNSSDVVHEALILGEDGKYRNLEQVNFWSSIVFSPNISDEKFERVMDMIDYSVTDEAQKFLNLGIEGEDWKDENGELVSLLPEGTTLEDKYPGRFEGLYVLGDDFSVINPAIKKEFRDRSVELYKEKATLSTEGNEMAAYDWDFQLYSSKAKDQANFTYETEYANLILQKGDLETNWKNWVASKQSIVQPLIDELNSEFAK